MSVGEVLDFIYTYINMKNKQTNHNNNKNNNKQNNISQGETFSYGRVGEDGNPMTLEQIMAMEWWEQKNSNCSTS